MLSILMNKMNQRKSDCNEQFVFLAKNVLFDHPHTSTINFMLKFTFRIGDDYVYGLNLIKSGV